MSTYYLDQLTEEEITVLCEAPARVAVLIAGADSDIDRKELNRAITLANYRTFTSDPVLHDYYERVNVGFETVLAKLIEDWKPKFSETELIAELEQLNPILVKMEQEFSDKLKTSLRSFAQKIAETSGGLLGFQSIDYRERKLVHLPMIH